MKFFSLARAMFSQDMEFLSYRLKAKGSGKTTKALLPIALVTIIMLAIGVYSYSVIIFLNSIGAPNLVPTAIILIITIMDLFEGVYKTQGILFESKDNDLVFALPVPRSQIFALRVIKLLVFQIIYNAIFMVPVLVSYALVVNPEVSFYFISLLMLFLAPLIPTAVAVVIGYIVKAVSLKFRHQKAFQIIFTFAAIALIMLVISNAEGLKADLSANSLIISDTISSSYYPAGAYARLISNFSFGELFGLIAVCVLPLLVIIWLCSVRYFKVISKSKVVLEHANKSIAIAAQRRHSKIVALVKKEIGRMFASPVFVVNTLVGPVLLIAGVTVASFNLEGIASLFSSEEAAFTTEDLNLIAPLFYIGAVILMSTMTSITSSMISIEGKSFNITKSLPVSSKQILMGKLLASLVASLPLFLIADLIFIIRFTPSVFYSIIIVLIPVLILTFSGLAGLITNLKYPKMDATSETEVVKQSASSLIAVFVGMIVGIGSILFLIIIAIFTPLDAGLVIAILYVIIDFVLYKVLSTWGIKKFRQIEI